MKRIIKVVVWFLVINFAICNNVWAEPTTYWWVIEIAVLIISLIVSD